LARPLAVAAAVLATVPGLVGCGETGVADGATLSVYVSAPLCAEARQALRRSGSSVGDYRLRAVCIDDRGGGGVDRLAAIGAAARQATEDSAAIAYLGTAEPLAIRFSRPILAEADLPRISAASGSAAAERLVLGLRRAGDSSSLREALAEQLR
jgi:hypothetical protein